MLNNTYSLPDGFLPGECQCHVNTMECHPVNLLFPAVPVPPHEGIAVSADILIEAEPKEKNTINA